MPNDFHSLIAKLDALNHDALVAAERKALAAVGDVIKVAVVNAAPVKQAQWKGGILQEYELKGSFIAAVHIASDEATLKGASDNVTVRPVGKGANAAAEWLEYGHKGPKSNSPATDPHPFIRAAADGVEAKAVETYQKMMTEEIAKVMK